MFTKCGCGGRLDCEKCAEAEDKAMDFYLTRAKKSHEKALKLERKIKNR